MSLLSNDKSICGMCGSLIDTTNRNPEDCYDIDICENCIPKDMDEDF